MIIESKPLHKKKKRLAKRNSLKKEGSQSSEKVGQISTMSSENYKVPQMTLWKSGFIKVVLEGYRRCPDSHDPSECHHLYDLGRHI